MQNRIKEIRKHFNLTQQAFADKLGLQQNTIAVYELGRLTPSDRTISDICRIWKVSEIWLRTGEGEMFEPKPQAEELQAFMGDLLSGPPSFKRQFITALTKLTDSQWDVLRQMAENLAEEQKKEADRD